MNYDISGVVVQQFQLNGVYFALGECVGLPVTVHVFLTKMGPRYSLNLAPNGIEGAF